MLIIAPFIVLFLYLVRTVRTILYHLAWWEIKEYRFDRMKVHVFETYQGRQWAVGWMSLIKWLLLLSYVVTPEKILNDQLFATLVLLVYSFEGVKDLVDLTIGWKLPPLRPRVVGIWIGILAVLSLLFLVPLIQPLRFLIIDKAIGSGIALLVFLSNRVFDIHKRRVMQRAKKKIARYPGLVVIGITGSYGKTSTKEFIAHIVATKFKTVKTLASQNTDIGIAERIIQANLTDVEVFVCEMAAYHPGEIASSCSIFGDKIHVAVITGINEQHQSLFGSIETTMNAKYELVRAVSPGGSAIFNGENGLCREMSAWNHNEKVAKIVINKTHVHELPKTITGSHFKQNVSLACAAGQAVGMTHRETNAAIADLSLPPRTMNVIESGTVEFIDDTFNANPAAVYAALDYVKRKKGKKVLVLQPLIELGKYAGELHQEMGKRAAEICDEIVLTNKNFNTPFLAGAAMVEGGLKKVHIAEQPKKITEGVMLFEGKEAEKYLKVTG
jgi:UDP-N-acetylmuramoyl-tripeptide--D-alanyl-D-alanine ligase